VDIRHIFFKYRSYTPIPLILIALILAKTSWQSFIVGMFFVFLGEGIRFWGVAYAGGATRTTKRASGNRLITNGPFGHVRNPLYLGNFLLSFGLVIIAWAWMPWMACLFISLFGIQYGFIVHLEEEYLSQQFGKQYTDYVKSVRRWIPRLNPYSGSETANPNYYKALRSERNTFQAIVAVCGLLIIRWQLL
jgi:protein-S-isoprenylcysteine O-methyltransferase Ste14